MDVCILKLGLVILNIPTVGQLFFFSFFCCVVCFSLQHCCKLVICHVYPKIPKPAHLSPTIPYVQDFMHCTAGARTVD